jgi:hypothetical protein
MSQSKPSNVPTDVARKYVVHKFADGYRASILWPEVIALTRAFETEEDCIIYAVRKIRTHTLAQYARKRNETKQKMAQRPQNFKPKPR